MINLTFSKSSDPPSLKKAKMTFRGNLETAVIPYSSHIKVCERRDIKVREARYELLF